MENFDITSVLNQRIYLLIIVASVSDRYSLHINCGGNEVTVNGTTFESDTDSAGPSNLFESKTNWAVSTTGYFADNDSPKDSYTTGNSSRLTVANPELYMNARLSPISLTYYAFCLGNGNYTVKLHFAEIMFTNDKNYSSLGRRLFDVYIQVAYQTYSN